MYKKILVLFVLLVCSIDAMGYSQRAKSSPSRSSPTRSFTPRPSPSPKPSIKPQTPKASPSPSVKPSSPKSSIFGSSSSNSAKKSEESKTAWDNRKSSSSSSSNTPPKVSINSGKSSYTPSTKEYRNVQKHVTVEHVREYHVHHDNFYRPYIGRTVVRYNDWYDPYWFFYLNSLNSNVTSLWYYHHWDSLAEERRQALLKENAGLQAQLAVLKSQGVTPDPSYTPPGVDPLMMYQEDAINDMAPTDYSTFFRVLKWILGICVIITLIVVIFKVNFKVLG